MPTGCNSTDEELDDFYRGLANDRYVRLKRLEALGERIVRLRGAGWQRRQEMHDAISELGELLGIGPHPTGTP